MWDEETNDLAVIDEPGTLATAPTPALGRVADDTSPLALMVQAAQRITRDVPSLLAQAKQIGGLLGSGGFYRFPAGDGTVEGASIDLAQALAQVWGGIAYQVRILHVETLSTGGRKVHLRATVTDLKTLVAAEVDQVVSTSAPPGKFARKPDQAERWHTMQTQSAASKIVRNAILRVLPAWYVDAALTAAREVDAKSATRGLSLPEARAKAVEALRHLGLSAPELEAFTAQPIDLWAAPQLAQLRDLAADLKAARVSVEQVRASLKEEAAPKATTGRAALGIAPKATPKDDGDEPPPIPPTGTDGPRGGASNDTTTATGTGKEAAPVAGAGAHAMAKPVADLQRHLTGKPRGNGSDKELAEIVSAWAKRREELANEGLGDEALDVVRAELRGRGCGDPDAFIQGVLRKRTGT